MSNTLHPFSHSFFPNCPMMLTILIVLKQRQSDTQQFEVIFTVTISHFGMEILDLSQALSGSDIERHKGWSVCWVISTHGPSRAELALFVHLVGNVSQCIPKECTNDIAYGFTYIYFCLFFYISPFIKNYELKPAFSFKSYIHII